MELLIAQLTWTVAVAVPAAFVALLTLAVAGVRALLRAGARQAERVAVDRFNTIDRRSTEGAIMA